jgi:putative lipoprotein
VHKHPLSLFIVLSLVAIALTVALPAGAQSTAVTGTVTYLQRSALPPDAVVTVKLVDISKADAPAEVISEQTITAEGKQAPFPYSLPYDPAKIVESNSYAVQGRIESGGVLLFISTSVIPVITRGNPTENVEIIVQPVGGTPEQPATLPTAGGFGLPIAALLAGASAGAGLLLRRILG